jgi:RNA polymerase sigma factor (sigma-70 family)
MKNLPKDLTSTRWTLIRRLKNWADQESWRQFFDNYWKLIYTVAIRSGLSDAEAQDAVQETVISVCKSIKDFQADPAHGSFKSWLLNLTRWRITDQMRKRRHELHHADLRLRPEGQSPSSGTPPEGRIPDPAANELETLWETEWKAHLVESALAKVRQHAGAQHYQIFYLQAIKQVPPAKIAETLGVSVDQVYLVKHRLSKLFDEALEVADTGIP